MRERGGHGVARSEQMAPRGLKSFLKKTAPCKLVGRGKFCGFAPLQNGRAEARKLKGLHKRLAKTVFSSGTLPMLAKRGAPRAGGHWRGPGGGRARGKKVDAQLSRIINAGPAAYKKAVGSFYKLTKAVFAALAYHRLEPVLAQRAVRSARCATAADILCFDKPNKQLVVIELKCGHPYGRKASAEKNGHACMMREPLKGAKDCTINRHLAQVAATRHMLAQEAGLASKLEELGMDPQIAGKLVYAEDDGVEVYDLSDWWMRRGKRLLEVL